jgi:hypothetical protein
MNVCIALSPSSVGIAVLLLVAACLHRWRGRGWLATVAGVLMGVAPAVLVVAAALLWLIIGEGSGATTCTSIFWI